jgi:hypothetical protein
MLDTVFGLPVHPLIVHATVAVIPTAAVALLLSALWPRFRRWAGWGPAALAVLALVLTPLSTSSGESLEHRVGQSPLVEHHAHLAGMMIWWTVPLAVLALVAYALHRTGRLTSGGRALRVALAVVSVVVAVGTLVQVVLVGHSGAKAAWAGTGSASSSSSGAADDGDGH